MKLQTNCSEAVFRFYTLEPEKIQFILQKIADEISNNSDFEPHQNQTIPLFERAEDYDTQYHQPTDAEYQEHLDKLGSIRTEFDNNRISKEEFDRQMDIECKRFDNLKYPNDALVRACAGLGDNEAVVSIERNKGAFRLNIGNNDISENRTGWIEKVESLRIKIEEAETCKNLQKFARDCTCGIIFFPSSARRQQQRETEEIIKQLNAKKKVDTEKTLGE